jgi:type II secretory ATPase GspE/PulE/Tfp pilus assembly ATPase PilB-like protein
MPTALSLLEKHMTFSELETHRTQVSAVGVLNALLREGHAARASDLHLVPTPDAVIARLRVDGALRDSHFIPLHLHAELMTRLKILAGLRTDEHQVAQDGRFRFVILDQAIDVRLSLAPSYHGENAVLRLLSSRKDFSTFSSLGLLESHQRIIREALSTHRGLILITGPTGVGKTSTLYALLQFLNSRTRSIVTIEDPIEYSLDGITQIPANGQRGISFAEGLRSMLRHDPDIIAIGEIRDTETATLALNAALTGHLIISTLHSMHAPAALIRLMNMGIEPYLISSSVTLVINQRLLPRLCTNCKTKKRLTRSQMLQLEQAHLLYSDMLPPTKYQYIGRGCATCAGTGSNGRTGIFEILPIGPALQELCESKTSARKLYAEALAQGFEPLLLDGLRKAAQGIVRLDDVLPFAQ